MNGREAEMICKFVLLQVGKEDGVEGGEKGWTRIYRSVHDCFPYLITSISDARILDTWMLTVLAACSIMPDRFKARYSSIVLTFLRVPSARKDPAGMLEWFLSQQLIRRPGQIASLV